MTVMKYLIALLMMLGLSLSVIADDQDVEHTHEDNENLYGDDSCDNDIDDDGDGDVDGDDDDCQFAAVLFSADDFDADNLRPYLVWGVGIALLSSVESSDTGTATN